MGRFRYGILGLVLFSILGTSARADEVYTFIVKKQEEKKQTRSGWNLADWIAQRDHRRTQDLWLAMNTPTPYEFSLGGDYRFLDSPKDERDHRFRLEAFAKIFGLTLERESEPGRWNAFANVRLFGLHQQGTNLTVFGGLRSQSEPRSFRSAVLGASATLYVSRFAGIEAQYRKIMDANYDPAGSGKGGAQTEVNLFIDFKFLRIYGGMLRSRIDPTREKGTQLGLRLFF